VSGTLEALSAQPNMNLKQLLPNVAANAETLLLSVALQHATTGSVDLKHADADAMAIALFALVSQLETEHPGIAAKYGWVRLSDLQGVGANINAALQATPPAGLQ